MSGPVTPARDMPSAPDERAVLGALVAAQLVLDGEDWMIEGYRMDDEAARAREPLRPSPQRRWALLRRALADLPDVQQAAREIAEEIST